jgi:hypothetical protein
MQPLFINLRELKQEHKKNALGFIELSTDEQIAKKIFEATGDKTFKGFLPLTWNTAQIVKMRNARDILKAAGKLTVLNMGLRNPGISPAAHDYFLRNADKIKGIIPDNLQLPTLKSFSPLFIAAGLAAAAVLFISIKPYLPPPKAKK